MHLDDYPVADESLIDERLNEVTRLAQRVSSMGRAARSRAQIKVRQPLQTVLVKTRTDSEKALLETAAPQIIDELNVRTVTPVSGESDVVSYVIQPNLPVLGPKYGREVAQIRQALESADPGGSRCPSFGWPASNGRRVHSGTRGSSSIHKGTGRLQRIV